MCQRFEFSSKPFDTLVRGFCFANMMHRMSRAPENLREVFRFFYPIFKMETSGNNDGITRSKCWNNRERAEGKYPPKREKDPPQNPQEALFYSARLIFHEISVAEWSGECFTVIGRPGILEILMYSLIAGRKTGRSHFPNKGIRKGALAVEFINGCVFLGGCHKAYYSKCHHLMAIAKN